MTSLPQLARHVNDLRRSRSVRANDSKAASISVVCVSDTHNAKPHIPAGDVLIHAGDLSGKGSFAEIQDQLDWLNAQPHQHKIVIAGNHDLLLDPEFVDRFPERIIERPGTARADLDFGSLIYLCNETVTLSFNSGRTLRVYGNPLTPQCGNWAHQYPPIRDVFKGIIPQDIDILITHGPPAMYLDEARGRHAGCPHLLRAIHSIRPHLHIFGHIHGGFGVEQVRLDNIQANYDLIRVGEGSPMHLLKMMIGVVKQRLLGRDRDHLCTTLVNAAVASDGDEAGRKDPIIVQI